MTTIDLPDGEYTAVVDSIEDGLATVFFEQDGDEVGDALLDVSQVPNDGQHTDAVFSAIIMDGGIEESLYDPEQTKQRSEAAQSRFDRLSSRPPSEDDS
jgi:hypothetical protein